MKTSINNGYNLSSLKWDYFITLNRIIPTSILKWEIEINKIMNENNFNQLYWSCEKSKSVNGTYHVHLLVDTNFGDETNQKLILYFSKYFVNGREIFYNSNYTASPLFHQLTEYHGKKIIYDPLTEENKRLLEYKKTRTLIDSNNQRIEKDVIEREYIPFYEIKGRDGRGYIEKIKGVRNTALYISKFTDRAITTGYLKK
jgi:hypothetical protein